MSAQRRARVIVGIRRAVQTLTLALFLWLLLATRTGLSEQPSGWLQLFFDLDPLIFSSTWLSTHTLAGLSLLAVLTLGVTVLLGRVFCGWVCPFGTLHNMMASLRGKLRRVLPRTEGYSRWQRAKYFLLVGLLVMALCGAHWIGVVDPISMIYRSLACAALPVIQYGVEDAATEVYQSDPHLGPLHLTSATEPVYRFFRDRVFGPTRAAFRGGGIIFCVLLLALLLNLYRARFWCRYICPLGALLGLCARRSILRLGASTGECNQCGLCTMHCPAAARPETPDQWLPAECFGCWNCVASCQNSGLDFALTPLWRRTPVGSVDLKKRATLAAVAGGIVGMLWLRVTPQAQGRSFNPLLIRPPGARREREFLQRCVQCGMCMQVCPTNALHPTWHEAGLEGVWTPLLVARLGYCEYECNLCGQVCPTEAIQPLPLAEKKRIKIGLATVDTTRCLPYAYGRDCIVCEEHCPIPNKAIFFVTAQITLRDGTQRTVKQPRVDADLCTGCGICENVCPFKDVPAIRLTSANETRHPENQPLLPQEEGVLPDAYGGNPY